MDKYDEIIGKCPHCGRNLTSDHVCPKLASMTMSTHWEGCWEEHHACAVAAIRELKARLEIDPRHSIDGIAARDATIRMLEERVAELETELLGVKEYREKNPLGGPAKVFDAMADQIRAGDDYNAVLKEYGFCHEAELARVKAHAEAMAGANTDTSTSATASAKSQPIPEAGRFITHPC